MKILIYGAGVIGSIYAAKLLMAGESVFLLARDRRYDDLLADGIVLRDAVTGEKMVTRVPLVRRLGPDDDYDLIIVAVRMDQFASIVPALSENRACLRILLLFNTPENIDQLIGQIGSARIILGFPGVGGILRGNEINYLLIQQQPTTMGELNGMLSSRIKELGRLFARAGFPVSLTDNIRAWLDTHAVFISCISAAIVRANGDSRQLSANWAAIRQMTCAIREGFQACRDLGLPVKPVNLGIIFLFMPRWFCEWYWLRAMMGKIGVLSIAPHVGAAKEEMRLLARKTLHLIQKAGRPCPALDALLKEFLER